MLLVLTGVNLKIKLNCSRPSGLHVCHHLVFVAFMIHDGSRPTPTEDEKCFQWGGSNHLRQLRHYHDPLQVFILWWEVCGSALSAQRQRWKQALQDRQKEVEKNMIQKEEGIGASKTHELRVCLFVCVCALAIERPSVRQDRVADKYW